MSGDLSLSGSLGGLRIANPDDDEQPVVSPTTQPTDSATRPPPPSSRSSDSTLTDLRRPNLLPTISQQTSEHGSGLDWNPENYTLQGSADSPANPTAFQPPDGAQEGYGGSQPRLGHRQSMPMDYRGQQTVQYPSHSSSISPQIRGPGSQSTSIRPISGMYMQGNTSSSSAVSSQASYGYRGDLSSSDSNTSGLARSGSRSSRQLLSSIPSRDNSRVYRQSSEQMNGGNGPLPPRRNSRRNRAPTAGMNGYENADTQPYTGTGPMPKNAEEWRERGAAVMSKQETDASGQPTTRVVKKGVKDFNFGRTLGEGSYSTVLAATDRQNLKEYAIKVLDKRHIIKEKKVKYVNIERDTLNRLTEHPGVVRLYYTFQDERSLYFVLDLATGGELLGVLKKMGSFDMECTRFYGAEILDAIAYMHTRGVIHRDLKPENVLLDRDMHVKITDFGTAKILSQEVQSNGSTTGRGDTPGALTDGAETDRAVSFVGTAEYVSPELLRDKNACKSSDLWAFGCIIYQLLAGRPPFKAANEYLTFQKILGLEYTFPEGFPDVARDLIERLLVLDPANRLPVEHIKNHRFFEGVQWGKNLWKQKAPRLKPYVPPAAQPIKLNLNGSSPAGYSPAGAPAPMQPQMAPQPLPNTTRPQLRGITELAPPSQLDIDWSPVLTRNNERILKLGNLIVFSSPQPHSPNSRNGDPGTPPEKPKFSRFFSGSATKKRERLVLITSSARVVIAAAGGNEKKAKLDVNLMSSGTVWKSFTDAKGLTAWSVDTRDKHLTFEDPRATTSDPAGSKFSTQEWLDSIEQAREIAAAQSQANSYSGGSMLNGLSSPASTANDGDGVMPMSGPSTGGTHLRNTLRRAPDDGESLKGRKRFSKRHSKSGLAAVF